jgi:preprotein translocase subunit YajC
MKRGADMGTLLVSIIFIVSIIVVVIAASVRRSAAGKWYTVLGRSFYLPVIVVGVGFIGFTVWDMVQGGPGATMMVMPFVVLFAAVWFTAWSREKPKQ